MDDEVTRLDQLGAVVARRYLDHVAMADPEANEFCVEPGSVSS
jgi:Glyoxalase-like domain